MIMHHLNRWYRIMIENQAAEKMNTCALLPYPFSSYEEAKEYVRSLTSVNSMYPFCDSCRYYIFYEDKSSKERMIQISAFDWLADEINEEDEE